MLRFCWAERHLWKPATEAPPGAGEYLASDGIETWVIQRLSASPFVWFCRVRWWRAIA